MQHLPECAIAAVMVLHKLYRSEVIGRELSLLRGLGQSLRAARALSRSPSAGDEPAPAPTPTAAPRQPKAAACAVPSPEQ